MNIKVEDLTICHNCKGTLLKEHIGKKCPYCEEWTYTDLSNKALEELQKE